MGIAEVAGAVLGLVLIVGTPAAIVWLAWRLARRGGRAAGNAVGGWLDARNAAQHPTPVQAPGLYGNTPAPYTTHQGTPGGPGAQGYGYTYPQPQQQVPTVVHPYYFDPHPGVHPVQHDTTPQQPQPAPQQQAPQPEQQQGARQPQQVNDVAQPARRWW